MFKDDTINILADPVEELVCPECEHAIDVSGRDMLSPINCPECGSDLTVPARLGDFILVQALGAGGMATVYKAYDQSLGRYVAIKIMRRKFGGDPKFVERFLREARAAARLNHPNVVQIYSCAAKNGQPYIVMEFVDGGKFDQQIAQDAPLDEKRVLEVALDVANGLRAAGDIGLVHGDIKPANIIFDRNGLAKVADFGLAHFAQEQEERDEIWGTPYYIAPERARKQSQDHRADIYCLGASLFHALTGQPPFDGETAVDVVMERLKHPAPDLSELRPEISQSTAKLVGRMLEAEKIKRYPNYNSLISDLEKTLVEVRKTTGSATHTATGKSREHKSSSEKKSGGSSKKIWIVLFIALALLGLGIGAWLLLPDGSPRTTDQTDELPAEDPRPQLQPFDPERDARLSKILGGMNPSTSIASASELAGFYQGMASEDSRRLWCQLLRGVTWMLQGDNNDALSRYGKISAIETDAAQAELPRRMAAFMAGDSDTFQSSEEAWPQWYSDLGLLFTGIKSLANQQTEDALEKLQAFQNSEPSSDSPSWPYSLKELARELSSKIEAWEKLAQEAGELASANKFDAAIKMLRERVRTGLFRALRDAEIVKIEEAQKPFIAQQKEQQRRQQEQQARQKRAAAEQQARAEDQQRLERWKSEGRGLLIENNYGAASELLQQLKSEMNTEAAKAELQSTAADLQYLKRMKDFMVAAINSAPYSGSQKALGGTAVAANDSEIAVQASGGARKTVEWSRVTPRVLIAMSRFYLSQAQIEDDWKAEVFMGLAAYSELNDLGGAERFVQFAEQLKPGISN